MASTGASAAVRPNVAHTERKESRRAHVEFSIVATFSVFVTVIVSIRVQRIRINRCNELGVQKIIHERGRIQIVMVGKGTVLVRHIPQIIISKQMGLHFFQPT